MNKENNVLTELPNLSPSSRRSFLFKNNSKKPNRVLKRKPLTVQKMDLDDRKIGINRFKSRKVSSYEELLSKSFVAKNNEAASKEEGLTEGDTKERHFNTTLKIKNNILASLSKNKELNFDSAEKALANFNAEKSSSAPLRLTKKQNKHMLMNENAPKHEKENLKNEFWIGESFKEKLGSDYRPLLNWKKQQSAKYETSGDYKPLWQPNINNHSGKSLSPLKPSNTKEVLSTSSSVYTGETYNDPNTLFHATEKNKKLYEKIGGYKRNILEMRQEHNKLEMMKIPMITYEISKKEIVLNKLKDDMRFFNKDIERIKQNQELMEEENDIRIKNFKVKLDVKMSDFLAEQTKFSQRNTEEQEEKHLKWKLASEKEKKELENLRTMKQQLIADNEKLDGEIQDKKLREKLMLKNLRQERENEIELEQDEFIKSNLNFVLNKNLEKRKIELLTESDMKQQEIDKSSLLLQDIIQNITDEKFLLSTVTDDEQMKSSELMKYGLEKMHPLEKQLVDLKEKLERTMLEEQSLKKDHAKITKFITVLEKKIESLKPRSL
ncbi:hypothetical protein QEN19_000166 [Hanseniaspora menglaensis]